MTRFHFLFLLVVGLFLSVAPHSRADGAWIHTGDAVRVKSVAFITVNVYAIGHDMKEKPPAKSKQAVIDANVDKRFVWTMLRGVPTEKIRNALTDAFKINGFTGDPRIAQFVGTFKQEEIPEKANVIITYNAAAKSTSISVGGGGGAATIAGEDFMKAVWKIWFGKIDQPAMGDQLISKL